MDQATAVLRAHPAPPATLDAILVALRACAECAAACTGCADACLAEEMVADLRTCIRLDLDCAAICTVTGAVLSRLTVETEPVVRVQLSACVAACRDCGSQCRTHAAMHAHCAACAQACHLCEEACTAMLVALH